MISGFSYVSTSPKTNIVYLWRHQDRSSKSKKNESFWGNLILVNLEILVIAKSDCVEKGRAPKHPDDPSKIFEKTWMRDQSLPKTMKWNVGKMGSIYYSKK